MEKIIPEKRKENFDIEPQQIENIGVLEETRSELDLMRQEIWADYLMEIRYNFLELQKLDNDTEKLSRAYKLLSDLNYHNIEGDEDLVKEIEDFINNIGIEEKTESFDTSKKPKENKDNVGSTLGEALIKYLKEISDDINEINTSKNPEFQSMASYKLATKLYYDFKRFIGKDSTDQSKNTSLNNDVEVDSSETPKNSIQEYINNKKEQINKIRENPDPALRIKYSYQLMTILIDDDIEGVDLLVEELEYIIDQSTINPETISGNSVNIKPLKVIFDLGDKEIVDYIDEEDERIFDIPSSEANHNIIARYLWENAGKQEFVLSTGIIREQLVNNLVDSYRNELISEQSGLENYLMWHDKLEDIFEDELGDLYSYFEGASLLAFTESRFKPTKDNKYKAGGYFQITGSTAEILDLRKTKHIDERKDILKSAVGAARHLKFSFNRWFNRELYLNYKDNLDQSKCEVYTIKKGDIIADIAKEYNMPEDVLIDYNNLSIKSLQIGDNILIPIESAYNITKEERNNIVDSSVSLSLASYNGRIVEDMANITSYDDYLGKFTELLKETKKFGDEMAYIKLRIDQEDSVEGINRLFERALYLYSYLNQRYFDGQYWNKRILMLKTYMFNDFPLSVKKEALMHLINESEKKCSHKSINSSKGKEHEHNSIHLKRWFTTILTQNLLYPPNLWAMQKIQNGIETGQDDVIKLSIESQPHLDVVTIVSKPNIHGKPITLYNIAKNLGIELSELKTLNPHIKKNVWNLVSGIPLDKEGKKTSPINIYLPHGRGNDMKMYGYDIEINQLRKREIVIDKTKITKEERVFRPIGLEGNYKKFEYTIRNYDTVFDIKQDLIKKGHINPKIFNKSGRLLKKTLNPGDTVMILSSLNH